jgi:hypothetical protein
VVGTDSPGKGPYIYIYIYICIHIYAYIMHIHTIHTIGMRLVDGSGYR